jgi:gluconolactonase
MRFSTFKKTLEPIILKSSLILFLLLLFFSSSSEAQQQAVTAPGAKLKLISNQFSFTEGPAADKDGNVFFVDQPDNSIWKYSTAGKLTLFMHPAGRSNGMYFDHQGNLISCADEHDQLWSISPDKKVTVLVKNYKGRRLNGPNDVWVDRKDGIYFTDPYYQRDYWTRTKPDIKKQRVYYLAPTRQEIMIVVDDMSKPNGIIGTPDGEKLYISDIAAHKVYSYSIKPDGHLTNKTLFAKKSTDGMTLDSEGNVYLSTPQGVVVIDKKGKQIQKIEMPHQPSNVTFGGKKNQTLFITARTAFYSLKMRVKGAQYDF